MGFLSEPIRANRGALIAGTIALLVIGVGLGRMSLSEKVAAPQPEQSSSGAKNSLPSIPRGNTSSGKSGDASGLDISTPKLRGASLTERGYELAREDIESAMDALASIGEQADRDAFLEGMFAYIAQHLEPLAATELAASLEHIDRRIALRELAAAWTSERTRESAESLIDRYGLEAGIGLALAWDEAFKPEIEKAWLEAFGDDEGIGVMLGAFAGKRVADDPAAALAMGEQLRGWQREVFLRALTAEWASRNPTEAWDWANGDAPNSPGNLTGVHSDILRRWAGEDSAAATAALATLTDPAERRAAVAKIAEVIALQDGTIAAVDWANALSSPDEQEAAHGAISTTAPQGIGAALRYDNGAAVVGALIPGGAADRGGQLKVGDRIVEVDPGTGHFELAYGRNLEHSMDLIRGEAGSTMRVRVVRENASGALEDHIIEIQREQIVLPGVRDVAEP